MLSHRWVQEVRAETFTFGIFRDIILLRGFSLAKSALRSKGNKLPFDVDQYLSNTGASRRIAMYKKGQALFSQDDPCNEVWYIQSGNAKLAIVNPQGKEAVLAILGPGDFIGEGRIIGNPVRMATATALAPLSATIIEKKESCGSFTSNPSFPKNSSTICWNAISRSRPISWICSSIPAKSASRARF
jgi:hypothetical protein